MTADRRRFRFLRFLAKLAVVVLVLGDGCCHRAPLRSLLSLRRQGARGRNRAGDGRQRGRRIGGSASAPQARRRGGPRDLRSRRRARPTADGVARVGVRHARLRRIRSRDEGARARAAADHAPSRRRKDRRAPGRAEVCGASRRAETVSVAQARDPRRLVLAPHEGGERDRAHGRRRRHRVRRNDGRRARTDRRHRGDGEGGGDGHPVPERARHARADPGADHRPVVPALHGDGLVRAHRGAGDRARALREDRARALGRADGTEGARRGIGDVRHRRARRPECAAGLGRAARAMAEALRHQRARAGEDVHVRGDHRRVEACRSADRRRSAGRALGRWAGRGPRLGRSGDEGRAGVRDRREPRLRRHPAIDRRGAEPVGRLRGGRGGAGRGPAQSARYLRELRHRRGEPPRRERSRGQGHRAGPRFPCRRRERPAPPRRQRDPPRGVGGRYAQHTRPRDRGHRLRLRRAPRHRSRHGGRLLGAPAARRDRARGHRPHEGAHRGPVQPAPRGRDGRRRELRVLRDGVRGRDDGDAFLRHEGAVARLVPGAEGRDGLRGHARDRLQARRCNRSPDPDRPRTAQRRRSGCGSRSRGSRRRSPAGACG